MVPQKSTAGKYSPSDAVAVGPEHMDSLVDCHIAALPTDVITLLGREFLKRHYRFYAQQDDGVCLVTIDKPSGRVSGFVIGGGPCLRKRFIMRNMSFFVTMVLLRSVVNRRVRRRFTSPLWRALGKITSRLHLLPAGRPQAKIPRESAARWAVLLTLGTRPDFRGQGAGKALVAAFEVECARLGFEAARLITKMDNAAANAVYQNAGWRIIGTVGDFNHYRKDVAGGRSGPGSSSDTRNLW